MTKSKFCRIKRIVFNKTLNFAFSSITLVSLFFLTLFVVISLSGLYKKHGFSIDFTEAGVTSFFATFTWCKDYMKACFIVFPIYFALSTYRVYEANKENSEKKDFLNNVINPRIEELNNRLIVIESKNKRMFAQITSLEREIIEDIMRKEEKGVNSKKKLKKYFDKHIQEHLSIFEECEYHKCCCKREEPCSGKKCLIGPAIPPRNDKASHSLESFKEIAHKLFCISSKYSNFDDDIKSIYDEGVKEIRRVKKIRKSIEMQ